MKKFLAIILALTLVMGLCACGENAAGKGGGKGGMTDGKVNLSIGIGTNAMVLDHNNNALTKWVEETCNVNLQFIEFAGGTDIATQVSTTIAARQELPDILFGLNLGSKMIRRYGEDGYFVDMKDYFADRENKSKIFWDRMENELSEEDQEMIVDKMTDNETGAIYGFPKVETSLLDKIQFMPWINQTWLDNLGLEMPTNKDELRDVLRAFRDKDANGNGDPTDEIPLFGGHGTFCSNPIDWMLNFFVPYNASNMWLIGEDNKLVPVYTTDEYREGLKYINELYAEGLISPLMWTGGGDMNALITPAAGTSLCGVVLGHMTSHATMGNEVLYEYTPMDYWGSVVRNSSSCHITTFITEDCEYPEKAFEVLMALWSWDGSMRSRYGEYGVNWDDADEGAKSELGLEATYKLISDPLIQQGTAKWATMGANLNVYAEGETAQCADEMDDWTKKKAQMHAEAYAKFVEAEKNNNKPELLCPPVERTDEEAERVSAQSGNVSDYRKKSLTNFVTGKMDPHSDADWQEYLNKLDELGLPALVDSMQVAYDRS